MNTIERMKKERERKAKVMRRSMLAVLGYQFVAPVYGDVGLELEIEGNGLPHDVDYMAPDTYCIWDAKADGSLRGESREYVTDGPILIEEVEPMLAALYEEFKTSEAELRLSNRCSTHVHVNVSTLSVKTITSFIVLFSAVEELVTNWCGQSRVSNPFCLRVCDSVETLDFWEAFLSGEYPAPGNGMKYSAMNVKPLYSLGTIEFRALRASEDYTVPVKWAKFLWALRETARTKYHNPLSLAQAISANGIRGVIESIIRDNDLVEFWKEVLETDGNQQVGEMMRKGFLLAQPLLFKCQWDLLADKDDDQRAEGNEAQAERKAAREKRKEAMAKIEAMINQPGYAENGYPLKLPGEAEADYIARYYEYNRLVQIVNEDRG